MRQADDLLKALERIASFYNGDALTQKIVQVETNTRMKNKVYVRDFINKENMDLSLLQSAFVIKEIAGQINVVIHAIGILNALPFVLDDNEIIEYLSLGAGNTGKNFDLETNKRVAEFKFASWKGADTIRQNNTFIDFFNLVEFDTQKRKYLYVLSKKQIVNFLNNKRALSSVLSKNKTIHDKFHKIYGGRYTTVSEYYNDKKHMVEIVNLYEVIPGFDFVG